jgi:hypothetical protein
LTNKGRHFYCFLKEGAKKYDRDFKTPGNQEKVTSSSQVRGYGLFHPLQPGVENTLIGLIGDVSTVDESAFGPRRCEGHKEDQRALTRRQTGVSTPTTP